MSEQPRPIAVALRYDGDRAPRVVAKGHGELAQRILDEARRCGIPLQEAPELAALLAHIELGDFIPSSLYVAVAEVLAFAYRLRQDQSTTE